ncbi:hypothetical protein ACB094_02G083400 [Castanea mollissima]
MNFTYIYIYYFLQFRIKRKICIKKKKNKLKGNDGWKKSRACVYPLEVITFLYQKPSFKNKSFSQKPQSDPRQRENHIKSSTMVVRALVLPPAPRRLPHPSGQSSTSVDPVRFIHHPPHPFPAVFPFPIANLLSLLRRLFYHSSLLWNPHLRLRGEK